MEIILDFLKYQSYFLFWIPKISGFSNLENSIYKELIYHYFHFITTCCYNCTFDSDRDITK